MPLTLTPHRDTPCDAVAAIAVEVTRPRPTSLALRYRLEGDITRLAVPGWVRRSRADELWKTTCFEAFVRHGQGDAYHEFNLSPSGQWAAYGFNGYRQGMTIHPGVEPRDLDRQADSGRLDITATLDLDRLGLAPDAAWRLGLSAVIEETNGRKSYWALAHAPGKPDFHHPDSFACVLEPP